MDVNLKNCGEKKKEEATFGEKLCKKRRPLATW